MPNIRILSARQRRELYESITPNETIIEVVGGKNYGYIGTVVSKSDYYGQRVNRNNNYFMVTIQTKYKKTQVGCNNIKIHEEVKHNMKVRCTHTAKVNSKHWTVGKVYEMDHINGIKSDSGEAFKTFLSTKYKGSLLERWHKFSKGTTFEEVKEDMNNVKNNEFSKDMLKTGMVVKLRSGEYAIVFDTHILRKKARMNLFSLNKDLTWEHGDIYDIKSVYTIKENQTTLEDMLSGIGLTLIWERQEKI